MKNWYATLLKTFVQDYDRRMKPMRRFYNATNDVLCFVSLLQCFNVYALLTYVVYPDCRTCTSCDAGCRATLAGISWVFRLALNAVFWADNHAVQPLEPRFSRKLYQAFTGYAILSVLLLVPWK